MKIANERYFFKDKLTAEGEEQYHIILWMLEHDEELIEFNKKLAKARDKVYQKEQRAKRNELKQIKKETDKLMNEYQKYIREINNELNKMMKLPKFKKDERNLLWRKL